MAAIRIDLEGDAEESLHSLNQTFETTANRVGEVSASSAKLSQVQQQQITIIHEQRAAWSQVGAEAVKAVGNAIPPALSLAKAVLSSAHAVRDTALDIARETIPSLAKWAAGTTAVVTVLNHLGFTHDATRNKAKEHAEAMRLVTAEMKGVEQQTQSTNKSLLATAAFSGLAAAQFLTFTGAISTGTTAAIGSLQTLYSSAKLTYTGIKLLTTSSPYARAAILAVAAASTTASSVLESTGRTSIGFATDWSKATKSQIEDYKQLEAQAKASGVSIETAMRAAGKTLTDFGAVRTEQFVSNLDRSTKALKELGGEVVEVYSEAKSAIAAVAAELNPLPAIWRVIDDTTTYVTKKVIERIKATQSTIARLRRTMALAGTAAFGGDVQAHADEIDALKKRAAETERLAAVQEKQRQSVSKFAIARGNAAKEAEREARQYEIAQMKSVEAIDDRIAAVTRQAREEAIAGKTTVESAKEFEETLKALQRTRTQVVRDEAKARAEAERRSADETRRAHQDLYDEIKSQARQTEIETAKADGAGIAEIHAIKMRHIEEEAEARSASAKNAEELAKSEAIAERERITELESFRREQIQQTAERRKKDVAWDREQRKASNEVEDARREFADQMELHSLELKLKANDRIEATTAAQREQAYRRERNDSQQLHKLRLELIERETDRNMRAAQTREEELKAETEGAKKRAQELARFKMSLDDQEAAHRQQIEEAAARRKAEANERLKEAAKPLGEQIVNAQTGQQRIRELQQKRAEEAATKFMKDNESLFNSSADDPRAKQQFQRQQEAAMQAARRKALDDIRGNRVGADEQAEVSQRLAKGTIQGLQRVGQLSGESVQVMTTLTQAVAEEQAANAALRRQVAELAKAANALRGNAQQQRRQAQGGSLG